MPQPCESALDVGCGDGVLLPKLAQRAKQVTGIDVSPDMISRARENADRVNVRCVVGDFLSYPLPAGGCDFIVAAAVLHHMPLEPALIRCAELLGHGGVLAVVGLARNTSVFDYVLSAAAVPAIQITHLKRGFWESPAPKRDPEMSFTQIRTVAARILPGMDMRRRLYYRYTILWRKS